MTGAEMKTQDTNNKNSIPIWGYCARYYGLFGL